MAAELTREYVNRRECEAPAHVLFPQLRQIVDRYLLERVSRRRSLGPRLIAHARILSDSPRCAKIERLDGGAEGI